jgi:hypothetical protein
MPEQKLSKNQIKKLENLVKWLVTGEARKIRLSNEGTRKVNRRFNTPKQYKELDEIKYEIIQFFGFNNLQYSPTLLEELALENIKRHMNQGFKDASYETLKDRIESGKYDFNFLKPTHLKTF